MKKLFKSLTFFQKCVLIANLILILLVMFAYMLAYIPPKWFEYSSFTLFTPILLIINIFFLIYWVVKKKKQFVISFVVFLVSLHNFDLFFNISPKEQRKASDLSLMTFNVRVLNQYNWNSDKTIPDKIVDFLKEKHPNVVALQEFHKSKDKNFNFYKYRKIIYKNQGDKIGQAILSDYPIISSGSLNFPNTGNNGIFADIVLEKDTIRLYSLHFESFHIDPEIQVGDISQENSKKILSNITKRFETQQGQVEIFQAHKLHCPYNVVVCGDFNNTAYSYLYKKIKGDDLIDSFQRCGNGFGKTLNFKYFPFRIDYILVDKRYKVTSFEVFSDVNLSDHYPLLSTIRKDSVYL